MRYDEFIKVVKVMKSIWTKSDFLPDAEAVRTYYALLEDIPYEYMTLAVQSYAMTNKWPPTVAELREQVVKMQDESADWSDSWENVIRCVQRHGYVDSAGAYEEMDEITKLTVQRIGWTQICQADVSDPSIRANFRDIYKQEQNKQRDLAAIPDKLQNAIAMVVGGGQKQLTENNDGRE